MRILYVTTVGSTMGFFKDFIWNIMDQGHTVDIATNEENRKVPDCYREWGCKIYPISTSRSPLDKGNLHAIKQIQTLVENNRYDMVHCHTPIAAMCTRIACRKARKNGMKVLYTAHGFHFYKGAPLINWLLYLPMEWICSFFTDTLITINQEDFTRAKKLLHAKRIEYIPGVGVDTEKIEAITINREEKRKELGIGENEIAVLSVGELNDNKNHETILRAIAQMEDEKPTYIICGRGPKEAYLSNLAKELGVRLILCGYRDDVIEICKACDIFVLPSKREGLGIAALEAMATGLPLVGSDVHGIPDYLKNGENGFRYAPLDVQGFSEGIRILMKNKDLRIKIGRENMESVKAFNIKLVSEMMGKIYAGESV